ncbi:MAG: transcription elongation factor GreA [Deltaproteobacteria bacterium]|nr:MAG: transcription elongation factor GreA [Deltaproteobacteria bacterium]
MERVPMTPQGYQQLQEELKRLKSEERPRIIRAIEEARDHGDLSENAEYDAAKESQAQLDRRIGEIEDKLARAEVIRPEDTQGDRVVFGARVLITDLNNDRQLSYRLVGEDEADRSQNKISVRSPLARAMIGKVVGDMFVVQTPGGEREYVVDEIHFD